MTLPLPAPLFKPPYAACIFVYTRTTGDNGYAERAEEMAKLAANQPGFLGVDSVIDADRYGILVSYWRDEQSITAWREHAATRPRGPRAATAGTRQSPYTSRRWNGPTDSPGPPRAAEPRPATSRAGVTHLCRRSASLPHQITKSDCRIYLPTLEILQNHRKQRGIATPNRSLPDGQEPRGSPNDCRSGGPRAKWG